MTKKTQPAKTQWVQRLADQKTEPKLGRTFADDAKPILEA